MMVRPALIGIVMALSIPDEAISTRSRALRSREATPPVLQDDAESRFTRADDDSSDMGLED